MRVYKISDLCDVISGGTPSTQVSEYWNNDIVWLTPKDLSQNKSKYVINSLTRISNAGLQNSSTKIVPVNTVLLSSRAPIGYLAISKVKLCTNQGFKSLICNDSIIKNEYLYYILLTKIEDLNNISTGSIFKELSTSVLKDYKINIHSLSEQQHIVNLLGSIDDKIEYNEKMCEKLEKFLSVCYLSLIRKVEKNVKLSSIANIESGKRPAKVSYTNSCEYPYPILGATGVIGYTDKYLTNDKILVIGRVGTHGVIQIIQERAWASDNTLFITTKFYSFCWNILKNIDYKSLNKGSTQPLITQTDMNNVLVAFPSKDGLNKFEEKGSIVLRKRKELKHQTQKLTVLKQLYLKKFFR